MDVRRGVGLAGPVIYVMLLAVSQTFTDLVNQISVHMSFFLLGLIAALLMRTWWSVPVVPAVTVVLLLVLSAVTPEDASVPGSTEIDTSGQAIMLVLFVAIAPMVFGAAIGSLVTVGVAPDEYA